MDDVIKDCKSVLRGVWKEAMGGEAMPAITAEELATMVDPAAELALIEAEAKREASDDIDEIDTLTPSA